MGDYYILNDKREPVPVDNLKQWARWFEAAERRVADTTIGDVRVSTIFLGLDHSFCNDGPALLFETMIFGGEHNEWQDRCSTWKQAEEMHERACALVRGRLQ